MTNIQVVFNPSPHVLKLDVGYYPHSLPYVGFQLLKIVVFELLDEVLHTTPADRIQWG
jgi:hypothetical protein